jgi:hypothetical protein
MKLTKKLLKVCPQERWAERQATRREATTNKEKDLGTQATLDRVFRKELIATRNQGGPNPPKGETLKSLINNEGNFMEL